MTTNADQAELEGLLRLRYEEVAQLKAKVERLSRDLEIWRRNGGDVLQRAKIERLEAALREIAEISVTDYRDTAWAIDKARATLEGK